LAELSSDIPTLIIGDALRILQNVPQESVDLIYSDIPYDDLEGHRKIGTTTRLKESNGSKMKWYEVISYENTIPFFSLILKKGHHFYDWRPSFNQESIKNWCRLIDPETGILAQNGFTVAKILPVPKDYAGMGYSFRARHENLLFCIKAINHKIQLNDLSLPDVINEHWIHPKSSQRIHDSQKPIEIARKVIECSSKKNDIVLEPTTGSFQSGLANSIYKLQRKVIGIEINKEIAQRTIDHFKFNDLELKILDLTNL